MCWLSVVCAGGIGYFLVEQFHAQGCHVIATARSVESMEGLRALPRVQLMQLDVCKSDSIKAAVSGVMKTSGRIDILVRACTVGV
jgi:NADP-dependent 3-hydroxy acid dehydrogenase YdfG